MIRMMPCNWAGLFSSWSFRLILQRQAAFTGRMFPSMIPDTSSDRVDSRRGAGMLGDGRCSMCVVNLTPLSVCSHSAHMCEQATCMSELCRSERAGHSECCHWFNLHGDEPATREGYPGDCLSIMTGLSCGVFVAWCSVIGV